jgi:hypothetical protein
LRLRELRDALLTRSLDDARWPRPFRYTGQPFRHRGSDGKPLQPGEVVLLERDYYFAWRDRFEPVAPEPTSAP